MNQKHLVFIGAAVCGLFIIASSARAQGTAFVYQGQLNSGGTPASGNYDFIFALYDSPASSGAQIGNSITVRNLGVTNGLFTTALDFGSVFSGNPTWLSVSVQTNGGTNFLALSPLEELKPTPYAIYAANSATASSVTGAISISQLPGAVVTNGAAGVNVTGTFGGNGQGLTNVPGTLVPLPAGNLFLGSSLGIDTLNANRPLAIAGAGASGEWLSLQDAGGNERWHLNNLLGGLNFSQTDVADNRLFLGANGNVGLGTSSPGQNLSVATSVADGAASTASFGLYAFGGHQWIEQSVSGFDTNTTGNGTPAGSLQFLDSFTSTLGLTLTPSGSAGIGTPSPRTRLTVDVGNGGNSSYPAALFQVENCGGPCGQPAWTEAARLWNQNPNGRVGLSFLCGTTGALSDYPNVYIGTGDYGAQSDFRVATWNGSGLTDRLYLNGTTGNFGIYNNNPQARLDVSGSGIFSGEVTALAINITSDRNAKKGFKAISPREVLAKVAGMPISEWQYKDEKESSLKPARHIGPMAQDFSAAFKLGPDDKHISVVDEGGVALAAIQGLNEKLEEKNQEVERLKESVAELRNLVNQITLPQDGGAQ